MYTNEVQRLFPRGDISKKGKAHKRNLNITPESLCQFQSNKAQRILG